MKKQVRFASGIWRIDLADNGAVLCDDPGRRIYRMGADSSDAIPADWHGRPGSIIFEIDVKENA